MKHYTLFTHKATNILKISAILMLRVSDFPETINLIAQTQYLSPSCIICHLNSKIYEYKIQITSLHKFFPEFRKLRQCQEVANKIPVMESFMSFNMKL